MAAAVARRRKSDVEEQPFYTQATPQLLSEQPADPTEGKVSAKELADWQTLYDHNEQQFQSLYSWRLGTWSTWGQIARYMQPWRYYVFVTANIYSQGLREDYAIVDRTATLAGEACAAGLMATLTDPERAWLELGPAIANFDLDKPGKMYYQELTERLNYVYEHSNFYEAQAQMYEDLTFFGTGPVIDYESKTNILEVFNPCAGEYLIGVGMNNRANTFMREFKQTVRQSVDMFGVENCPEDVQKMWRQKGSALQNENIIGHCIEPNFAIEGAKGEEVGRVPGGFTWRENYWLRGKKDRKPLSMSGFHEQPFAVNIWNTRGNEPYGRGIGESMLGDTVQLQLETRQKAMSIEKVNNPPMGADVALMNQPSSTDPGKITYMNTGAGGEKKFFPLFEVKPDIPAITADIQIIQERIGRTAYNDVFQRLMTLRTQTGLKSDLTATEVDQLTEEGMIRLGPMIGRQYRTLQERVRRHLAIMKRRGLLPKKPPSLQGVPLDITFVSLLTEARRALKTQSVAKTVQFAGSIAGEWPEARYAIDVIKAIGKFGDGVGAPADIIRTDREVKGMIAQAKKEQQTAQLLAQTQQGAAAASALSKTSLAPGNALSALIGNPAGGGQA